MKLILNLFCLLLLFVSCKKEQSEKGLVENHTEQVDNSKGLWMASNILDNSNRFAKRVARYSASSVDNTLLASTYGKSLELSAIIEEMGEDKHLFDIKTAKYSVIAHGSDGFKKYKNLNLTKKKYVVYDTVKVADEISSLFHPDNLECILPKKIKRKLQRRKGWIPSSIQKRTKKLPQIAYKLDDAGISILLNTFYVKPVNGGLEYQVTAISSPTYNSLDVQNFIDKNRTEFAYSLDCSGYLSAAFSAEADAKTIEIKSSASSALDKSNSLILARAHIFSPLLSALRPNQFPSNNEMSDKDKLGVLTSIISYIPATANDLDKIEIPMELDVMWTSKSGTSKFNGEGKLSGGGGASFGIASLNFNSKAGASITRSTAFSEYNSYLLNAEIINNPSPITVGEVRTAISNLVKRSVVIAPPKKINNDYVFTIELPVSLNYLNWQIKEAGYSVLKSINNKKGCEFTISGGSGNNNLITLKSNLKGISIERKVSIP